MPFYRFLVQGWDVHLGKDERGFFTTRHAFGADQQSAAEKVLARLRREFTTGASAKIWNSPAPALSIEKGWRIGLHQLFSAPNSGSTFYDDEEESESQ